MQMYQICAEIAVALPRALWKPTRFKGFARTNIPLDFIINSREENVLFQDFTDNHYKTYVQITNSRLAEGVIGFDMILSIETDETREPLVIVVPFLQTRSVQLENVRRVTVASAFQPFPFQQRVSFYLEKTFCMSCSDGGQL
jgi:hypothetical protein